MKKAPLLLQIFGEGLSKKSQSRFKGGWAVLETLDSLIINLLQFSSVSRMCESSISSYQVILV